MKTQKFVKFFLLLIIVVILLSFLCDICFYEYYTQKSLDSYTYSTDCQLSSGIQTVIDYYKFKKVDKNGDFFFTSLYNPCERTVLSLINSKSKYIGITDGCDIIGSKIALWEILKKTYNNEAKDIMPQTYLYNNPKDMIELQKELSNNKKQMYVLKNYKQRQEGIKIVTSWDEINSDINKKEFLLAQKYVYDPLIISKRKTNCRIYYLILCKNNPRHFYGYIYYDGFMYYTPDFYDPNDTHSDKHITTGYIDRSVYETNPLTLQDLRSYLGTEKSKIFDKNLQNMMKKVTYALSLYMCKNTQLYNKTLFQIYGVDIAPTSDLNIKLMEINKGPDLNAKDGRDGELKLNMQKDMIKLILGEDISNRFINVNL